MIVTSIKKAPKNRASKTLLLYVIYSTNYLLNNEEIIPETTKDKYFGRSVSWF